MSVWTWIQASLWLSMFVSEAWSDNNPGELLNLTPVQSNNSSKRELELNPAHYLRSKPLNPPKRKQTVSQNSHIWARVSETHNYSSIARGKMWDMLCVRQRNNRIRLKLKLSCLESESFRDECFSVSVLVCVGQQQSGHFLTEQAVTPLTAYKSDTKANLPLASKRPFH